jgi:hypothetical protein
MWAKPISLMYYSFKLERNTISMVSVMEFRYRTVLWSEWLIK